MNKVYVVEMYSNWNPDYLAVFESVDVLAEELSKNIFDDDCIYIKPIDIKKHILQRERNCNVYLFFPEEINPHITKDMQCSNYIVRRVPILKKVYGK